MEAKAKYIALNIADRGNTAQDLGGRTPLGTDRGKWISLQTEAPEIAEKLKRVRARSSSDDKFMMDGHKLLWHLDRVNDWANNKRIAPLHIDLGITTGCNMGCTYCYGVVQGRTGFLTTVNQRYDMPRDAILRLFKEAKEVGVRSIAIIGEGENTLNPAFYDAVDYARKINLDISLATNGTVFHGEKIYDMLAALTWIRINLSAASHELFVKIHQLKPYYFDRVLDNVRTLVRTKNENGLSVTIGLQMVVTKENIDQIVPLAKLGGELGVDYFVVKPCSDTPEKFLDSPDAEYLQIENILQEAESYSSKNYHVVVKWHKLLNMGLKEYRTCSGTQFIIAISGDGSVFPCGHWFNVRREEFIMGNVIEQSFKDIVQSERYWDVQKKVYCTVNVNKDCESNCRPHYVNNFLWGLQNRPPHVNFI